jgi:radical SAM superfamily enzyme YgiQ (UPF0313 family)
MRISLVYPRYRTMLAGGLEEPLGIIYIAAALREAGHAVSLTDLTFERSLDSLDQAVKGADWVGLSSSTALFGKATEVLERIRAVVPGVPVVVGGPHATVATEDALRAGFDYAAVGEAEKTVVELSGLIAEGRERECSGIAWLECDGEESRGGGERGGNKGENDGEPGPGARVRINPRTEFVTDLEALPFPARDLLDYARYPTIGIVASRGCPFNCSYCQPTIENLFGKRVRSRSPENVVAEIEEALRIVGDKDVHFKDDTMPVLGLEWIEGFKDAISERGLRIRWAANSRVDTIDYDKLRVMREAGCVQIGFGVESGSPEVLGFYNKGADTAQVERVFDWCHELGILPHAFLMLGAPDETVEDLQMTYDLVRRIKPRSWSICTTTPLPGTHLHDYVVNQDLMNIPDDDYEGFDNAQNSLTGENPIRLRGATPEDLVRYRNKINHYLFFQNALRPEVIRKAIRRPGDAIRKLRKVI